MKKIIALGAITLFMYACNSKTSTEANKTDDNKESSGGDVAQYDPNRGQGKFTHVDIGDKLDETMASGGQKLYDVKCSGCHKLTEERLVGPGWKGVSIRNKPEWIMNFITNTDEMLNKDPKVQAQLEICLVRMPNQSLTDNDARQLLEFMRKNDGIK